ncbi:MAG: AAA family ATPase [Pseudomonadota bacterium]
MTHRTAVVVTGLPASGKTTLGREVAIALNFTFLDKDDFLEELYEQHGVDSWDERKALSREADILFQNAAKALDRVVLVSHWRGRDAPSDSGTPIEWLTQTFQNTFEIHCLCEPGTATERFFARQRHKGHLDAERDPFAVAQKMKEWSGYYPLNIGQVLEVDCTQDIGHLSAVDQLRNALPEQ